MTHPLDQAIATLRSAARRIGRTYGVAWTLTAIVSALVCLGLLDYYLRADFIPVRLLLSLGVVLIGTAAALRFLIPSLRRPLGDVALAQRLQARFPELEDRVASAIEFLHQPDDSPTAGSAMLRRAVIVDATYQVRQFNVGEVLDRRPARWALLAAGVVVAVATAMTVAWPAGTRIALARLTSPLGATRWPKVHELEFRKAPDRLASGQLFEVELIDRNGRLPDSVQIQYRLNGADGAQVQSEPMRRLGEVMVAHRDGVRRPFSYRAVGGDDDSMPWRDLSVIEPPRVETLGVTLQPPDYTGWPTETSNGPVTALVGTRLRMKVTTTKPLAEAALKHESGARVAAELAADGRSFVVPATGAAPLLVKDSGNYWFEIVDRQGIAGGTEDRWPMRAVPDEAPAVTLENPAADLYVTAEADVPVRVLAKDQLALKQIGLVLSRSDRSMDPDLKFDLFSGPEIVAPTQQTGLATAAEEGDRRVVVHDLKLAELKLPPGTQLLLHATATDYQPASSQSSSVRITIITPRQLDERLARQEALIFGELAQVVKMERDARSRVTELEIQVNEVASLKKRDLDQMQGVELAQRDVRRKLTAEGDGIRGQIDAILEQLAANKVNNPQIERRMRGLAELIDRLEKAELPDIQRELTSALKNAQAELEAAPPSANDDGGADQPNGAKSGSEKSPGEDKNLPQDKSASGGQPSGAPPPRAAQVGSGDRPKPSEAGRNLDTAGQQQDRVLAALEQSLEELQRSDNFRRLARELAEIEGQQLHASQQTQQLMQKTLGRDPKELAPQEVADLKKQAEKQLELARRFDKLLEGMQKASGELQKTDSLAAQSIDDALVHAQNTGISRQLRSAGDQVERNQVAAAVGQQQEADRNLQEMLDILANRREQELSRLVKKLRDAEAQLDDLKRQESALRKRMQEVAKQPDSEARRRELQRLAREQKELQQRAQRLARQLKRLDAEKSADKLAGAGSKMGASGESGQAGDAQRADQAAAEAQRDLEEAQRQLAGERRKAEIDLAQEELERLKDRLKAVDARQRSLLEETRRLEALRNEQKRLTRGQEVSVADLARHQSELAGETGEMARKLAAAEGFSLALKRASDEMTRASDQLTRLETGPAPQLAQRRALDRMALVLKALEEDKPDADMDPGGGGKPKGGNQQGDGIHTLSELKLLRLMQADLLARTDVLEERKRTGEPLTSAELSDLAELAEEQGRLADLMFKLHEPQDAAPENDPDKLPGGKPSEEPDAEEDRDPNSAKSDAAKALDPDAHPLGR